MKKEFSTHWIGSVQPRKQRKYRANAPLHIKRKMMSSNLTKELRRKYDKRNVPIRKGDLVRIMTGEFKGKTGKIEVVINQKMRVTIEGIYRTKKDGSKVSVNFNASNLQIKELILEDKKRVTSLTRRGASVKKKKENSEKVKSKVETKNNKENKK